MKKVTAAAGLTAAALAVMVHGPSTVMLGPGQRCTNVPDRLSWIWPVRSNGQNRMFSSTCFSSFAAAR